MSDIAHKAEKIASAIYLITSFFPQQEPLKWKLRTLSAEFVSLCLFIKDNIFVGGDSVSLEVRSLVLEMRSLASVAKNAGLISEPNFVLLREELDKYLEWLGLPTGLSEENGRAVLSSKFFEGDKALEAPKNSLPTQETERSVDKPHQEVKDRFIRDTRASNTSHEKEGLLPKLSDITQGHKTSHPQTPEKSKPDGLKAFGAVSVKKNSRQSIIINLLKRKKEVMIKDITPLVNGCSEKTVQRELLAMVQAGVLKKVGEKRWSKYSLA